MFDNSSNMEDDIEFDVNCDPKNPKKIHYDDILAAKYRISRTGSIIQSPCMRSRISKSFDMDIYLKLESVQHTGSFKARGVCNTLLSLTDAQKKQGVITASIGNHGMALGYHAHLMGIECIIVMPTYSIISKVIKCQSYGANVILYGMNIEEAKHHAFTIRNEKNMIYINGYDHPRMIEGNGTIGVEIADQLPALDAVLVPVGGGGLLAGVAIAIKHLMPHVKVYGVCTDKTNSMLESLSLNNRTRIEIDTTLAEGLAVNLVGVNTFFNINRKHIVKEVVMVEEEWVTAAIMHLMEEDRYIVEGAGAVPIAAIMAGLFPKLKGKRVACICSGGNIDTTILGRVLERGMASEGRLIKFKVTVKDRPGSLEELCKLLVDTGVTIREYEPESAWVRGDIFGCELHVTVETRNWQHTKLLENAIKNNYNKYFFKHFADRSRTKRTGNCLAPDPVCLGRHRSYYF